MGTSKPPSGTVDKNGASFPRNPLAQVLRIPEAIIKQNAGKDCTDAEAAKFVGSSLHGDMRQEIGSAIKYGVLERPAPGRVKPTELAKKIIRPQGPNDALEGKRAALLKAPGFSEVYQHYRGENLPDPQFFDNALTDNFHIPREKLAAFKDVFGSLLEYAELVENRDGHKRLLDISQSAEFRDEAGDPIKKLEKAVTVKADATCFVMMPFADPLGRYYQSIYEPAIKKAGLQPVRADAEIFATGKIIDQVWRGINAATVLVAELTTRNPNVFYELGLAHALKKPVVLVSANAQDVPFDVRHIRVIFYDVNDPFWGEKLINKVAENILSAIKNPEEAIFKGETQP